MADNKINVGGRLHSIATGNVLGGANEIFDDSKNKKQSDINTETYSLVNDVNERLSGLSPDQQSALTVAAKATNNETKLGYYVCGTEGNLAAKVISDATGYILSKGGSIKIKMTNANTANNATLNINSTGAKALYYDGERASAKNSWEAGETIEVYYDGTSFYANSVAGGSGSGDGVFDVSVKYPTSGVEGGNTYTLEGALAVLNANLPASKKKGGMSIKFVQSSDNNYVQARCMANSFTTDVTQWQGVATELIAGSRDLVESRCVYQLQQFVTEKYLRKSDYCAPENYIKSNIELISGGYYNYTADPVSYVELSGFACAKVNVIPGDMFRLQCNIAYSKLAAVIFLDENDNMLGYLYGDNTSTIVSVDTGIISAPPKCVSIAFNAYILDGSTPQLTKYETPKVLTEKDTIDIVVEIVNPNNDREISSVPVDSGHYYDGDTLEYKENEAFSCATANIKQTDKVSFHGSVRYSAIYGIIFADDEGTIISRMGHSRYETLDYDSGIVDVPNGATKVYFNALGSTFDAKIYSLPDVVNSINIEEYLGVIPIKTKYCNPYHYVFGVSQVSDIENSGFDSNFESSTANAFLIHSKYFKSYRRKHEWRLKLSSNSVVIAGTGARTDSVIVNSRMSKFKIDIPGGKLYIYTSEGVEYANVSLGTIDTSVVHIFRMEQYDYVQRVSLINEATLSVVATYTYTATPANSPTGKLLGFPYIQLLSGTIKVIRYDCYLMDKPKIVFVGDSITECGYRQNTYAAMLIQNELNNDGCIIAQGGANSDTMALSRDSEIVHMKPEYLSLLAGTNNGITHSQISGWVTFCNNNGIKLIVNCVPVSLDAESYPWSDKNSTILAEGILGARFDYATALNNDPDDGGNPSLFEDDVHPNAAGQLAMYHQFLNDVILV